VRCFSCGGCLENWRASDNVWHEHAKHFPQCEFLSSVKGPEYVADVQTGQVGWLYYTFAVGYMLFGCLVSL
jgi:baculoviral IAP repeat-containing protein 1